jgi:hypothetical protein
MLTNEEFTGVVKHLTGEKLSLRVAALDDLSQYPSADARILPTLTRLIYDKTPCLIGIPFLFAEIRWLAAHALAAERAALGIMKPVRLRNVVEPLDTGGVVSHEDKAGIDGRGGVEGVLSSFAILNDMGYLPRYELDLSYWIEKQPEEVPPVMGRLALAVA